MTKNVFIRDVKDYNFRLHPREDYIRQATLYMCKENGLDFDTNLVLVKKALKKAPTKDPIVKFRNRDDNNDIYEDTMFLSDYVKSAKANGEIIVPSYTTYVHPGVKKSLHAKFTEVNVKRRSIHKKKAFAAKSAGDFQTFIVENVLQKTMKVFNNSLSGAYASKSTILYNPSAHYTLTSITRCLSGTGNTISEMMINGNRLYITPDSVINSIMTAVQLVDRDKIKAMTAKYKLAVPTVEHMFKIVKHGSENYWKNAKYDAKIMDLLKKLDPEEAMCFTYTNDLYNMRVANEELLRNIIGRLSQKLPNKTDRADIDIVNDTEEFVINLVHHICAEEIRGNKIDYKGWIGTERLSLIAGTCDNISKIFNIIGDLIITFFVTDISPINTAYLKDMLRDVVVLSDTDSTCATYQTWTQWFMGRIELGAKSTAVSATVMTIVTQAMDHHLKLFSANMNVDKSMYNNLAMKNEFYWDVFVNTNVSKHYFALVRIQEGNVYKDPDLEIKGVHLISSKVNEEIRAISRKMMMDIMLTVSKNKKISLMHYINIVADVERMIVKKVNDGSIEMFNSERIKPSASYALEDSSSPYMHYLMWSEIFADKYGKIPPPPYTAIKLPTKLDKPAAMKEFIAGIEDENIKAKFEKFLVKHNKRAIGTFRLPMAQVWDHGIPKELLPAFDINRVIFDNCKTPYLILEAIGFYRKPDMTLLDHGY